MKEIQSVGLEILKDIHEFCMERGIEYSVSGGTLLGTVRHKGFIPWDDDVDVMMPRKEYERFCREYVSDKFKVLSFNNDKSCMIAFARVCDMRRTLVLEQAWTSEKVGIWVDVFPFDGAEDDFEAFKEHYSEIKEVWQKLFYNRALAGGVKDTNSSKLNLAIRLQNALHLGWVNQKLASCKVKYVDKNAQRIKFGDSRHVSQFAYLDPGFREYFELDAFLGTVDLPFEDTTVRAIKGYEHYLSRFYGNYMELPPVEQRVPKQDYLKFVWRDEDTV